MITLSVLLLLGVLFVIQAVTRSRAKNMQLGRNAKLESQIMGEQDFASCANQFFRRDRLLKMYEHPGFLAGYELGVLSWTVTWTFVLMAGVVFSAVRGARFRPIHMPKACSVLIPCYMPNEKHIIKHTVQSYTLHKCVSNVVLVYNGADETDVALDPDLVDDPKLTILCCEASRSRAENLAHALRHVDDLAEFTLIADSDNRPCAHCIEYLSQMLDQSPTTCCGVQGIVMQTGFSLVSLVSNGTLWLLGAAISPAFELFAGTCLFTGSACMIRTVLMRKYSFRPRHLDDMDFMWRVACDGLHMRSLVLAQMYELPVSNWVAFCKQRFRYVAGTEQSTCEHVCSMFRHPRLLLILLYVYGSYAMCVAQIGQLFFVTFDAVHITLLDMLIINGVNAVMIVVLVCAVIKIVHDLKDDRLDNQIRSIVVGGLFLPVVYVFHVFLFIYTAFRMHCMQSYTVQQVTVRPKTNVHSDVAHNSASLTP